MLLSRIVLCLALLAPCVGFAQDSGEAPRSTPSEPDTLPPPPLVPAPESPEAAPPQGELFPRELETAPPPGAPFSAGRAMLELLGGGLVGAGTGLLGLLLGTAVFFPLCESLECVVPILLSGAVGVSFGVPLGVYAAGHWLDGQGRYWISFVGTLVGGGMGLVAAELSGNETAAAIALISGPIIGAIVGYELSHAYPSTVPASRKPGAGVQVSPTLGLTLTGGIVGGLSGRF